MTLHPPLRLAAATLALALAGATHAAPETYVIDNTHTMPRFSYSHFGYSTQSASFAKLAGKITIDRAAKTGKVEVTIDARSVNTGYDLFNEHLEAEDFFDTAKYPAISFVGERMKFAGDKPVAVDGKLTIKGVTKPVTLKIGSFHCMPHPIVKKDACGANAETVVKRSDFNMGKYAPHVSDEVTLTIPVEAIKE